MAHPEQRAFFERVKHMHPASFRGVRVLDCGSLNVNGTLYDLFTGGGTYTGVDVVAGPGVDVVSKVHEFSPVSGMFDTIVSAEMLEHDPWWRESLRRMYGLLKPGGLLAISCAGPGRPEHGTPRTTGTDHVWTDPANPDYYRNISADDITGTFNSFGCRFKLHQVSQRDTWPQDTYFWGIKS